MNLPSHLAQVLARLSGVTPQADGWVAQCPCPGHSGGRGDQNPSLRVALGDEGQVLFACRTGCPVVGVLTALGLGWGDLWPDGPLDPGHYRPAPPRVEITEELASERDRAYRYLLSELTLEPGHRDHLLSRGFTDGDIAAGGYKSLRSSSVLTALRKKKPDFDPGAYTGRVPGLANTDDSPLWLGLAIPCRDPQGRVVALKVRRFGGKPKYVYLSDPRNRAGAPVHWPVVPQTKVAELYQMNMPRRLLVTEGELKADYLEGHTLQHAVSIPGVTNWQPLLTALAHSTYDEYLVAFDAPDYARNEGVLAQALELGDALQGTGTPVRYKYWEGPMKGLDDMLANGHADRVETLTRDELTARLSKTVLTIVPAAPPADEEAPTDPPGFPAGVYPPAVGEFVTAVAEATGTPVDFPAVCLLVTAGAAIGAARRISPAPGWTEAPNFYAAIVSPPGATKTPVISRITAPLVTAQRALLKTYLDAKKTAEMRGDKSWKGDLRELYTTDPTKAALITLLANNPRGVLVNTDEILGLVRTIDAGFSGNDHQFYLTAWSGNDYKENRRGSETGPSYLKHPYLGIFGSIQPKKLPELKAGGRGDDGFLDRFLFTYPPEWPEAYFNRVGLPATRSAVWDATYARLAGLPFSGDYDIRPMTPAALDAFEAWYNDEHVRDLRDPLFPDHLKGFLRKLRAYTLRFALVLEYLHWAQSPAAAEPVVGQRSVERAVELARYFQAHAERVSRDIVPQDEQRQVSALVKLARRKGGTVTAVQAVRAKVPDLPTKVADMRTLMLTAQVYGFGQYTPERDGKKDLFGVPGC